MFEQILSHSSQTHLKSFQKRDKLVPSSATVNKHLQLSRVSQVEREPCWSALIVISSNSNHTKPSSAGRSAPTKQEKKNVRGSQPKVELLQTSPHQVGEKVAEF